MKSKIILCLLLIMTVLTFGACGDTVDKDNDLVDNGNVNQDVDDAVDDAQRDMNDMDGKDSTKGANDTGVDLDNGVID